MFEKLKLSMASFSEKLTKTELKGKSLEDTLDQLRLTLLENDVAYVVADHICAEIKRKVQGLTFSRFSEIKPQLREIISQTLLEVLSSKAEVDLVDVVAKKREVGEPAVLVFVGVNGSGKTTTIAKIARLLLKNGYSVVLACSDTYRTGSIEQLEEHANRVGVRTIKHRYGADASAVAFDAINYAKAHGINAVLIDTAGRMQTNKNLIEEMKKIARVTKPDLVILVADALTGNDAVEQGRVFNEEVGINGIILTKLDADAKGGSAISMAFVTGKSILYLGVGQRYDDLTPFDQQLIVKSIIG